MFFRHVALYLFSVKIVLFSGQCTVSKRILISMVFHQQGREFANSDYEWDQLPFGDKLYPT